MTANEDGTTKTEAMAAAEARAVRTQSATEKAGAEATAAAEPETAKPSSEESPAGAVEAARADSEPVLRRWRRRALFALAIGFGTGLSPKAPGTVGTLIGIPLAIALSAAHPIAQGCLILGFIWLAVRAAAVAEARFGTSDDGRVVSDEIAGYLVAMAFLPPEPINLLAAFVLFRLFDILKPWPCSHFDKKRHDAVGNVMDDVCAGLYARALLQAWIALWP